MSSYSHVDTEVHEFIWTIDNFDFLSANPDLLDEHVFPITIGSSLDKVSTWKLFLSQEENITPSRSTRLFFKLVEYDAPDEKISVAVQIRVEESSRAKYEWKMPPRNFTLGDDAVKCNMSKYVRASPSFSSPWSLYQSTAENLSLEQICRKLGTNNLSLIVTMKIFGKQSVTISENDASLPLEVEQTQSTKNHKDVMVAMLETGLGSDVTFETRDDQRIAAHRCILSMQSTVFAAMFSAEMKEKTDGVVKLVDMGGEGLKILLKFVYTGELEETWGKFYEEIINAANKYEIIPLIALCDRMLPAVVSWENCVELLKFAELHDMTDAIEKIKKFMKRDPEKLLQLWHVAAFGNRLEPESLSNSVIENAFNQDNQEYARQDYVAHAYDSSDDEY